MATTSTLTSTTNPWLRTAMQLSGTRTPYSPQAVQAPNINQSYAALGRAGGYRPASGSAVSTASQTGMVAGPTAGQAQAQPQQAAPQLPYVDWTAAGYGPSPYAPSSYQSAIPRTAQNSPTGQNINQRQQQLSTYQQSLFGPELSSLLGLQDGSNPLAYGDLPFIQMQLALQTQKQQEEDAARVYDNLARAYMGVGQDETSLSSKNQLNELLGAGGPYNAGLMDQLRGQVRNQAGITGRGVLRGAEEDFARRGLSGSMTEYELASLGQQQGAQMQSTLTGLEETAATANQAAVQQMLAELQSIAAQEAAQRQQYQIALAEYGTPQRSSPDLSSLQALMDMTNKKQRRYIGQ